MQARAFYAGAAHINALYKTEAEVETDGAAAAGREEGKRYAHDRQERQAHADVRYGLQCDKPEKAEADAAAEIVPRF